MLIPLVNANLPVGSCGIYVLCYIYIYGLNPVPMLNWLTLASVEKERERERVASIRNI